MKRPSSPDAVDEVESRESRETADSSKQQKKRHGERHLEIDGQRLLVADLGHTTIRSLIDPPEMMQATTQQECERKIDFALKLIHEARYHAQNGGALTARPKPGADTRILSKEEFDVGLEWLNGRYRQNYMTRSGLRETEFTPQQKKSLEATAETDSGRF